MSSAGIDALAMFARVAAIAGGIVAIPAFVRGSATVKFALLWMVLTYAPYTAWEGDFAQASRYLYLPAVGACVLAAKAIGGIESWGRRRWERGAATVTGLALAVIVIVNGAATQIWIRRNAENGVVREAFVDALFRAERIFDESKEIYIEVPARKYVDLRYACEFVSAKPVSCIAVTSEELPEVAIRSASLEEPVYWLRVSTQGFEQIYPARVGSVP
jgi:hypothetical protein